MPEGGKTLGVPVVIGKDNLPSPVRIGLTDLTNIWGPVAPLALPVPASLVFRLKNKLYKAPKVQKYALNSQLQALQILTNDDEVEN